MEENKSLNSPVTAAPFRRGFAVTIQHTFCEIASIFRVPGRWVFLLFAGLLLVPPLAGQDQTVRVAMAQIFCLDGDRSGNFVRIENAMSEARDAGADIVCFPETALLGWVNPDAHQRAHPIPGEDSDRLCALAREYGIYLCVGLAEKEGDKLYDAVLLIDNRGVIRMKHRKMNILTELMTPPYTPGTEVGAVETEFGTIGLLICADTFLEDALERMRNLEPDLLLVPYGWAYEEEGWPGHAEELRKRVQHVARATGAYVFGTDLVGEISHGPWTGQVYGGASVASDPGGTVIARGRDRDRDLVISDVSLNKSSKDTP